jgi:CrcB protein
MSQAHRRHPDPRAVAAVAAGALIGGPLRYGIDEWLPSTPDPIPLSTLAVNVAGSFVLAALLVVVFEAAWSVRYLREFAGIGVLGSFTTFSTWMVHLREQAAAGDWAWLGAYVIGSVVLGLAAAALGSTAARLATTRRRG